MPIDSDLSMAFEAFGVEIQRFRLRKYYPSPESTEEAAGYHLSFFVLFKPICIPGHKPETTGVQYHLSKST